MLDMFVLTMGRVTTPAMVFLLMWEDHVDNHVSLGVPPPNMDVQTPYQVKVTPANQKESSPPRWSTLCHVKLGPFPANQKVSNPSPWSILHYVKLGPYPCVLSTLHWVLLGSD